MPAGKVVVHRTAGKVRVQFIPGKPSTKPRVLAQHVKPVPRARCVTGYFCSECRPDYTMALAMGTHERLGKLSPVAPLTSDVLRMIVDLTKPKRTLPAWMSCNFKLDKA